MRSLRDHWIYTYRVIRRDRLSDPRITDMGDSGLLSAAVTLGLEKRLGTQLHYNISVELELLIAKALWGSMLE